LKKNGSTFEAKGTSIIQMFLKVDTDLFNDIGENIASLQSFREALNDSSVSVLIYGNLLGIHGMFPGNKIGVDSEWSFISVVCIRNVPPKERPEVA
jgi:hypothetical protein